MKQSSSLNQILKDKTPHLLVLFTAVLICYASSVTFDFTNWDDHWSVRDNPLIRSLSIESIGRMFNPFYPRFSFGGEYLPLRELSYAVDYKLVGLNPGFYHGENVLLYGGMVIAFYFFLFRFSDNRRFAFWGSLFFALHPVHCESVAWISARKDVLAGVFFVVALERYTLFIKTKKGYFLALFFYILSFLSKYTAFALPPLLVVLEIYFSRDSLKKSLPRALKKTLPFWVLTTGMVLLAMHIGKVHHIMPSDSLPLSKRIFTMGPVVVEYLQSLFLPLSLSPLYLVEKRGPDLPSLLSLLFLTAFLGVILWDFFRRKNPLNLSGLLFFICLAPVANLVPSPVLKADRYLFLPSLGYGLLLGYFCSYLLEKRPAKKKVLLGLYWALALFYGVLTLFQVSVWKNSETLWKAVLRYNPQSNIALTNLAIYKIQRGEWKEGEKFLRQGLQNNPGDKSLRYNWGILEMYRKNWRGALREFHFARERGYTSYLLNYQMGVVYQRIGKREEAKGEFLRVLKIHPQYAPARIGMVQIFLEEGKREEARLEAQKAFGSPEATEKDREALKKLFP